MLNITKKSAVASASALAAVVASSPAAMAIDIPGEAQNVKSNLIGTDNSNLNQDNIVERVVTFLIWAAVAAAVVMIIVGGIRYVISAGNQEKVTAAKNTILYAVIGLVIALLAAVIVNFVFDQVLET